MASTSWSQEGSGQLLKEEVLPPGTKLLTCEPFVYAGYRSSANFQFCDTCLTVDAKCSLFRCKSCRMVWYCNRICQEKGWNDGHKYECKGMKLHSQTLEDASGTSLWEDGTDHFDEFEIGGTKIQRRFSDLMSHSEELCQNKERLEHAGYVCGLAIKQLLGPTKSKIKIPSYHELIEIYGKVSTNAFEIGDGFFTVGAGVYLGSSIFNHSCDPVADRVYDGITMHVQNIKGIPKSFPIDKVTVCYTNPLVPSQERRRALQNAYHFHCECERCKTGLFDKEMRSIICSGKGCNAKIDTEEIKDPCSACGHVMEKKLVAELFGTEKFVCELIDRGNLDLPLIEGCIKKMKTFNFSDTHWVMIRLFHLAFRKAADRNRNTGIRMDIEAAFEYGSKYLTALKYYLHPYHIGRLWISCEMSGAAVCVGKLDEAEKYISEAKFIAEVLHGKDSPFMKQNVTLVEDAIRKAKILRERKQLPEPLLCRLLQRLC